MFAFLEQESSETIETIDFYMEQGYSYEDAYSLWEDDYNRGVLPSQEEFARELEIAEAELENAIAEMAAEKAAKDLPDETEAIKQGIIGLAMSRGYSKNEAATLAAKVVEMKKAGQYERAYKLFLARLFA